MALKNRASALRSLPSDPINSRADLARYLSESYKPVGEWCVGPEVELFGFTRRDLRRISPAQVQAVIDGFSPVIESREVEDGFVTEADISLAQVDKGSVSKHGALATSSGAAQRPAEWGRITLEPGGQIEFSGAPQKSLLHVEQGISNYLELLREIGDRTGIIFVAAGFDPICGVADQRWIPKRRYQIMRPYLMRRGRRAWDMMSRTAAIQANLDYGDLEDLAKKFAVANRLGPIAAAIFANSPLEEGRLSGYKSVRYAVWLETDPDRTGLSPLAVDGSFSIERFIDYASTVPMFFIRRGGAYVDMAGYSFAEFMRGSGGDKAPIMQDFGDHLSTVFTESRLKPHIEQRSADCGAPELMLAALAFWKGLMYHGEALDQALALAPRLDLSDFGALQLQVARHGLDARIGSVSVRAIAGASVELAVIGLRAIAPEEARYLDILEQYVVREQICPADILIRNLKGSWNGDARKAAEYLKI